MNATLKQDRNKEMRANCRDWFFGIEKYFYGIFILLFYCVCAMSQIFSSLFNSKHFIKKFV